jgi:hypothetical protein
MNHVYRYCSLTLAADRPLPELPAAASDATPDLEIVSGPVPATLPDEVRRTATFAHNGRETLWWLEGIGRFQVVAGGRRITVAPAPAVDDASLRLMLLYPVFAPASVLRGDWCHNAAAVARDGEVCAFIGPWQVHRGGAAPATRLPVGQRRPAATDAGGQRALFGPLAGALAATLAGHPLPTGAVGGGTDTGATGTGAVSPHPARVRSTLALVRIGLLREQRGDDLEGFVPSRRP